MTAWRNSTKKKKTFLQHSPAKHWVTDRFHNVYAYEMFTDTLEISETTINSAFYLSWATGFEHNDIRHPFFCYTLEVHSSKSTVSKYIAVGPNYRLNVALMSYAWVNRDSKRLVFDFVYLLVRFLCPSWILTLVKTNERGESRLLILKGSSQSVGTGLLLVLVKIMLIMFLF